MKQLATIAAILTLTACGGSNNPLAVVQDDQAQVDQDSETIDSSPVLVPNMAISAPVVNQEPVQQPVQEQNNQPVEVEPVNPPVILPEPVVPDDEPVMSEIEKSITGVWYCQQFGENFTWTFGEDKVVKKDDFFTIGTYWHTEGETFALSYSSGGFSEFTCDGETMSAGTMICSRNPFD